MRTLRSLADVAWLEIVDRRRLVLAALGIGLIAVLLPFMVHAGGFSAAELRGVFAFWAMALYLPALALLLGGSTLGRDLAERRLGFHFARPVGALALWAGKLAGAVLLLAVSAVLLALPALALRAPVTHGIADWDLPYQLLGFAGVLVVLVVVGGAASIAIRSRSAWTALDVAGLAVFGAVLVTGGGRIRNAGAALALTMGVGATVALFLIAIGIATACAFVSGRTDPKRVHRAQSITLWALAVLPAAGFLLYVRWLFAATPADLERVFYAVPAPRGSALAVTGLVRSRFDYYPTFLLDPSRGVSEKLPLVPLAEGFTFSGDGRTVAFATAFRRDAASVLVRRLDGSAAATAAIDPKVEVSADWAELALSADGGRLATADARALAVYELPSGRSLFASAAPPALAALCQQTFARPHLVALFFRDPDHVRLLRTTGCAEKGAGVTAEVLEVDLAARKLATLGAVEGAYRSLLVSRTGDRMVLWRSDRMELLDGAGHVVARLRDLDAQDDVSTTLLADGRVAVGVQHEEMAVLSVHAPDGTLERTVTLGRSRWVRPGGEITPGKVAVGLAADRVAIVDIASGALRIEQGLHAWAGRRRPAEWALAADPEPGSPGARLFLASEIGDWEARQWLVSLDPDTGARTPVFQIASGRRHPIR